MLTLLEEVMEEAQSSMQQIIDDTAMYKLAAFLIGDFYEMVASEKVENLKALHNA